MSGVYIKGMEMPTSCHDCEIGGAKQFDKAGNCPFYRLDWREQAKYSDRRVDGCPLVPVPPHGRLIDADEADSRFTPNYTELSDFQCGWNAAMKRVCKDAPAIIPADEGEK